MGKSDIDSDMVLRIILCLLFPPLAVYDKGCGAISMVLLFTLFGWLPGTILALLLYMKDRK